MIFMKLRVIGFFLICILIGFFIVAQARITDGQQIYVSAKTVSDYKTTIESEEEDTQRILKLVEETELKLTEIERLAQAEDGEDETIKNRFLEELEYYKLISNSTKVQGEGVTIVIDDATRELYEGEDPNVVLVHDWDILNILNELNRSGAEAITVNGQRLTNTSSISCSGYTIRINDQFFARPFEIKAIGDSKRMAASLVGPDGYGTLLKTYGIRFNLTISDDITLPNYTEEQNFQYLTNMTKEREGA